MDLLERLLFGAETLWGGGVAHSVLVLVITLGIALGKVKIAGVSLGVTGILFVGIAFSYAGMNIDGHLMHFLQEFGLILFVYSIGLQVGPGFFSSFRKGGITLNKVAILSVVLGVVTTVVLHFVTGLSITTMVVVLSGALTNPPALAYSSEQTLTDAPSVGYATVYPFSMFLRVLAAQLLILMFG